MVQRDDIMPQFQPAVRRWFTNSFDAPTAAQRLGWPAIASGENALILAPTGSGKTLAAFLWCLNQVMFSPVPLRERRCRVLYVSPLKALAVDVERNLRAPIAGISNVAAGSGEPFIQPAVAIRSGDTPQSERARFRRDPADILITTPESLYLLLTSRARETLRSVETVIIDEIHSMVPTKRGAHLALSLERLEEIAEKSPQRIGLSATQHPLDEIARFLGGAMTQTRGRGDAATRRRKAKSPSRPPFSASPRQAIHNEFEVTKEVKYRPVTIVDTGEKKQLELRVEVPVEEMARLAEPVEIPSGPASQGLVRSSIWPAIHPRLLALIRAHRSTLIFVNSRRLAERLAAALNELAGQTVAFAHHGSLARTRRIEIEDKLKAGELPALIATSSLELGIDMGAIDLVIQIEAPPSVASGMQRIGRAGHQVGATSRGVIFPKYRGDLLACASITRAMQEGRIEATRYPRNPLDVLAQQIVATVSMDPWTSDHLFAAVRRAAPFAELSRQIFDGVLDMLSGLYPSDEFAELRPRLTWNRLHDTITARPGAVKVAVINAGTIPDRGLYGVFLAGAEPGSNRVGELDEEMVFESRVGETFLLGASSWRIEEITHDRVLVTPAPGEPGKMPFWHGDAAERSVEFGEEIGRMTRQLVRLPREKATTLLTEKHSLDALAAGNLLVYLEEQRAATDAVPDDRTIVVERVRDELGDWRACVLSPFGGRVHTPWAMAVVARVREEKGLDVEAMWSDDGFIIRFPDSDEPPDPRLMIPSADEVESLVVRQLGSSALFAAKFREASSRALLLPKRRPDRRAPLWQQRKRAADLLQVASRFGSFPMLLETYRECMRDVFDMPALVSLMRRLERRDVKVVSAETERPSPFAGSLLFRYAANYIYDGDAPLAERRAQALAIDQAQLRELLGEIELRELLDAEVLEQVERELQHLEERRLAKHKDGVHDLLLRLGDLRLDEIEARSVSSAVARSVLDLVKDRRALKLNLAGEQRFAAIEDTSRFRDALGIPPPPGIPERLLQPVEDPIGDLVLRYARTHGPFTVEDVVRRLGIGRQPVQESLRRFVEMGRIIEGEFRPGGTQREWCEREVLRLVRQRSLARLRREVAPVEARVFARALASWQGVGKKRTGLNVLLDSIQLLQGYPLPASILETEILPARVEGYRSSDLDALTASGEVVWVGVGPLGPRDGRVALYLTDSISMLFQAPQAELDSKERSLVDLLRGRGALFFGAIQEELGGFPRDTVELLWDLVWKGIITNDTFHALRAFTRPPNSRVQRQRFRSRRQVPASGEGRWSLVEQMFPSRVSATRQAHAVAQQMLDRYGVVTRESAAAESLPGGFSAIYPVFKGLEESGKIRRGFFVGGVAATQFALPGAVDLLRSMRDQPEDPEVLFLAATDPANPYGSLLKWPETTSSRQLTRSVGASVILVDGQLACYLARGEKQIFVFLPDDEADRARMANAVARALSELVEEGERRAMLIASVDGQDIDRHPIASYLKAAGFIPSAQGYHLRGDVAGFRLRDPSIARPGLAKLS